LGIGDWGLGPIPNPQSPIPNPQSPIPILNINFYINFIFLKRTPNNLIKINKIVLIIVYLILFYPLNDCQKNLI
jgi:hypothetical protein